MEENFKQVPLFELPEEPYDPVFPPERVKGQRISAREAAFARFYFESRKLRESAVKAGYKEKNAHIIANRLVKKSLISDLILEWENAAIKRAGLTRERILAELGRLATFDPRKLYREDGSLKNPLEWDDDTAAAISSLEIFEEFQGQGEDRKLVGHNKKIKFWNKPDAIRSALQHFGLLVEKKEITGKDGGPLFELSALSDEELKKRAAELQRLMGLVQALDTAGK